jgi:hypothetical protein
MRQRQPHSRSVEQVLRHRDAIWLDERFSGFETHRFVERAGHCATDKKTINLWEKLFDYIDLAGDLGAAEYRNEGTDRIRESGAEVFQLLFHEQAGNGRTEVRRDSNRRCVRPMRSSKRIIDKEVAQLR